MGFVQSRKIKKGSVPTLRLNPLETDVPESSQANGSINKQYKEIVTSLLKESNITGTTFEHLATESPIEEPCDKEDELHDEQNSQRKLEFENLAKEINVMKNKISDLEKENFILKNAEQGFKKQIQSLQLKLRKSEYENNNIEEKLKEIITSGHIRKLKNGINRLTWTEEDIAKSIIPNVFSDKET